MGSFRSRFTTMLKEVSIKHVHIFPYNSKYNGGCERGIRSLKDCLKRDKIKKVTQQVLDELTYNIYSHPQDESVGSAAERFFGRSPRSCLPNSLNRFVDHCKLIESRKAKQIELAEKKGRSVPNNFLPGDRIVIQDNFTKRWDLHGMISEARISEDQKFSQRER